MILNGRCAVWVEGLHKLLSILTVLVLCSTQKSYIKYSFGSMHHVRSCSPRPVQLRATASFVPCQLLCDRSTCTKLFVAVRTMPQYRRTMWWVEDHLRIISFAVITSWQSIRRTRLPAFIALLYFTTFQQVIWKLSLDFHGYFTVNLLYKLATSVYICLSWWMW